MLLCLQVGRVQWKMRLSSRPSVRAARLLQPMQACLKHLALHPANVMRARLQVAQGNVRNVTAANAAQLMNEGWVLLDVRPPQEIEMAGVKGAVEV